MENFSKENSLAGEKSQKGNAAPKKFPLNCLHVCVDSCGEDLAGRVYCKMSREGLPFRNMGELLLRADILFDEKGYPQSFQEKRCFEGRPAWNNRHEAPKPFLTDEEVLRQRGAYWTFDILVYSRRKASWQGALLNPGRPGQSFESAKELLELLMEEMNARKEHYS